MTTLAVSILILIALYIGFLIFTSSHANKYTVIRSISTTVLEGKRTNLRISTVLINKTENPDDREAGLVILGTKKTLQGNMISNELTIPLDYLEVPSIIEVLKHGSPFSFTLGSKKEFKIVMDEHPDKAKILINTNVLFRQVYVVDIAKNDIEQLTSSFEMLLKTKTS